jgi:hypothetical protein
MAARRRSIATGSSDIPRPFDGLREIDELTLEDRVTVERVALRGADLSSATASGVELLDSHLVNVVLGEARLRGARMRDTVPLERGFSRCAAGGRRSARIHVGRPHRDRRASWAIIDPVQLVSLGPSMAAELGIQLNDGDAEG